MSAAADALDVLPLVADLDGLSLLIEWHHGEMHQSTPNLIAAQRRLGQAQEQARKEAAIEEFVAVYEEWATFGLDERFRTRLASMRLRPEDMRHPQARRQSSIQLNRHQRQQLASLFA